MECYVPVSVSLPRCSFVPRDCQQEGIVRTQTDRLIVHWVEYTECVRSTPQRTLTLRAENVSRRHIYRIDCQVGTPGSTVDQFFDSSLLTASWIEPRGRQVGISQFCIRSHLQSMRCLVIVFCRRIRITNYSVHSVRLEMIIYYTPTQSVI